MILVPLGQLFVLLCLLTALYAPAHAFAGVLPTWTSLGDLGGVLTEGMAELREQATPALPLTGLLALTTVLVGLIAVTVDLVAVAGRQPAVAGLGLLVLFCVPVSTIIGGIGLPAPDWINSETWIYPALSLMGLWAIGNFMIINIAGLQSVPTELYEAARMDGAGWWTSLRRITIPLMSPVLLYNLVIVMIATFQYFTQAYTLTNGRGDPNNATLFINLELFREAFVFSKMGYGAAIAWLLFAIVLLLTAALFWFARKRVYYAGGDR